MQALQLASSDDRPKAERRRAPSPPRKRTLYRYKKNEPVPTNLLRSTAFMAAAGLTVSEFNRLTLCGHLKPAAESHTVHRLYDRGEIERIHMMRDPTTGRLPFAKRAWTPTAYSASEAADVFRRIEQGEPLHRILIETGLHPAKLSAIRDHYLDLEGGILLKRASVDLLSKMPVSGAVLPLRTDEDVIAFFRCAVREQLCAFCRTSPRSARCVSCTRSGLERAARRTTNKPSATSEESDDPPPL